MALKQEPLDEMDSDPESEDPEKSFESVWVKSETVVVTPDHNLLYEPNCDMNPLENKKTEKKKREKKILQCNQCEFTTVYGNSLKYHKMSHGDDKPFSCQYCEFTSKYPPILTRHLNTQHAKLVLANAEPEIFSCPHCDYKTSIKINLKAHLRKHKKDKQFKCDLCSFATAYRHNFVKHSRTHQEGVYKCDKCSFETKFHGHISRHMEQIHNEIVEAKHVCEFCNTTSKEKWKLRKHKERSVQQQPITCMFCDFQTLYRCQMRKHKKIHVNDGDVERYVELSAAVMMQKVAEQEARKEKSGTDDTLYKCDKCSFETKYKGHMTRHLDKIHNEVVEANFVCEYCNTGSTEMQKIKQHKTRSFVRERIKCTLCNFQTFYKCQMKKHTLIDHSEIGSENNSNVELAPPVTDSVQERTDGYSQNELVNETPSVSTENSASTCEQYPSKTLYDNEMPKEPLVLPSSCKYCNQNFSDTWHLSVHTNKSKADHLIKCTYCVYGSYYKCEMQLHSTSHLTALCSARDGGANFEPDIASLLTNTLNPNLTNAPTAEMQKEQPVYKETNSSIHDVQNSDSQIGQSKFGKFLVDQNCIDWRSIQVIETNGCKDRYRCPLCDFSSKFKACVQRHFQRRHTDSQNRPYKCVNCDFSTKTKDAIALHNKRNPFGNILQCSACNHTTNYKCAHIYHQRLHYVHKCSICNYNYKHKHELIRHVATKHLGKGIKCKYCDFVSLRRDSLISHELGHTGERPFKCSMCLFQTVRKTLLDGHMKLRHNVDAKALDVKMIDDSKIESLKVQSTEDPPTAVVPENESENLVHSNLDITISFEDEDIKPDVNQLERDLKISSETHDIATEFLSVHDSNQEDDYHESESAEIFACDHCDFVSPIQKKLAAHIVRKHDSKRNKYKCGQCLYRTYKMSYLIKHKEKHKNASVYKCKKCTYQSKTKASMLRHLQSIHNKIVNSKHVCVYCNTATVGRFNLIVHRQRSHSDYAIKCTICNYKTFYKCQMKKHKLTHLLEPEDQKDETLIETESMYTVEKTSKKKSKKKSYPDDDSSSSEDKIQCEKCSFKTVDEELMSKHLVGAHNGCKHCNQCFINKSDLNDHVKNNKSDDGVKCFFCDFDSDFKCETCKHMCAHFTQLYEPGQEVDENLQEKVAAVIESFKETTGMINKTDSNEESKDFKAYFANLDNLQIQQNKFGNFLVDSNCVGKWGPSQSLEIEESGDVNRPYRCPVCEFTSKFKPSLRRHIKRNHFGERPFKCVDCGFATKTKDSISLHNARKISRKELHCSTCGFKAYVKCILAAHQKTHYQNQCVICNQKFSIKKGLINHFAVAHLGIGMKCRLCTFFAMSKAKIADHELTHNEKPFQCSVCGYLARRSTILEIHFKRHHQTLKQKDMKRNKFIKVEKSEDLETHKCDNCDYTALGKAKLSEHIRRKHTTTYMCEDCSFITPYKGVLKTHSRKHEQSSMYKCRQCPYESTFKGRILSHLEKFHNEKLQNKTHKLACEFCGEIQRSNYMLKTHEETARCEDVAICTICSYQTHYKCQLDKHEMAHNSSGEEYCPDSQKEPLYTVEKVAKDAFKCRFCYFTTGKKHTLVIHEATHTGEKPFKCNICSRSYKTKVLLSVHWKKQHSWKSDS